MYNASVTLPMLLHSICGQSNENWQLILIDDVSSDYHVRQSKSIISDFKSINCGRYADKIIDIWNTEKKWEVANVLHGISLCDDDNDIICRIDADDWLTDLDGLAYLSALYKQTGADALWTAHRWGFTDKNISASMPADVDPYKHPWVSSHLKTFRKELIKNVPYENFTNMNGDLVRRAGDQSIYLPVLYKSKIRGFVPRVMYHYTIDEQDGAIYQTDDAKFQKAEADFIRARGYIDKGKSWEEII